MKKVNRLFWCMVLTMLVCGSSYAVAQTSEKCPNSTPEKRIELRTAQMQQRLMLDEKTAAQFAPLYKEYLQALWACHSEVKCTKDATDAQIKETLSNRLKMQRALVDTQEKYLEKFSKLLTARQLEVIFKPSGACFKGHGKSSKRGHHPMMKSHGKACGACPFGVEKPA